MVQAAVLCKAVCLALALQLLNKRTLVGQALTTAPAHPTQDAVALDSCIWELPLVLERNVTLAPAQHLSSALLNFAGVSLACLPPPTSCPFAFALPFSFYMLI